MFEEIVYALVLKVSCGKCYVKAGLMLEVDLLSLNHVTAMIIFRIAHSYD